MSIITICLTFDERDDLFHLYRKAIESRFGSQEINFVNEDKIDDSILVVTDHVSDVYTPVRNKIPTVYIVWRHAQTSAPTGLTVGDLFRIDNHSDKLPQIVAHWLYNHFMKSKPQSVPSQVSTQNIPKPSSPRTSAPAQRPRSKRRFGTTSAFRGTTNIPRPKGLLDTE